MPAAQPSGEATGDNLRTPSRVRRATLNDVCEVVVYFDRAQPQRPEIPEQQLSPHLRPLSLSDTQIDDLTPLPETKLRDPALDRDELEEIPTRLCVTAADAVSVDEKRSRSEGFRRPKGPRHLSTS